MAAIDIVEAAKDIGKIVGKLKDIAVDPVRALTFNNRRRGVLGLSRGGFRLHQRSGRSRDGRACLWRSRWRNAGCGGSSRVL